jgi:excisionase family DNA binding protein
MSNTLYSKNDLADMLKLSVSTIDNKMNTGEIQFYKIGKSVRFDDSMITEFLQNQTGKMYKRKLYTHKNNDTDVSGLVNAFGMVK